MNWLTNPFPFRWTSKNCDSFGVKSLAVWRTSYFWCHICYCDGPAPSWWQHPDRTKCHLNKSSNYFLSQRRSARRSETERGGAMNGSFSRCPAADPVDWSYTRFTYPLERTVCTNTICTNRIRYRNCIRSTISCNMALCYNCPHPHFCC